MVPRAGKSKTRRRNIPINHFFREAPGITSGAAELKSLHTMLPCMSSKVLAYRLGIIETCKRVSVGLTGVASLKTFVNNRVETFNRKGDARLAFNSPGKTSGPHILDQDMRPVDDRVKDRGKPPTNLDFFVMGIVAGIVIAVIVFGQMGKM